MFEWLNDNSRKFLSRGYLKDWVTAEERIREMADVAQARLGIDDYSDKFYEYMGKWYYSLSSPVWSNYGLERWLPISCFGSYISDDMEDILRTNAEVGMMSKYGGWTSWYFWELRQRGAPIKNNGTSSWAVHFMQLFECLTDVVSQGSMRRWAFSPYLPLDHGDIMEFLDIWTEGNPIQKCTTWVVVPQGRLDSMIEGDVDKRKVWAKVIQRRWEMWYPYILYQDNANEGKPLVYKDTDMNIFASNLCSEIMLPSSKDESFVCCLSSMNVEKYDEWKDTDAVEVMVYFLNTVIDEFVEKSEWKWFMEMAMKFAKRHRAIWIWVLWRHSYLQSRMIPFGSKEAQQINVDVFKTINEKSYKASEKYFNSILIEKSDLLIKCGRANTTLMAVAPTTSSAFILGQASQSIEPWFSNYFVKDLAKDKVTIRNKNLEALLESKWMNTDEIWNTIKEDNGSVQNLAFLSKVEKEVFKTYSEISQYDVIYQAAARQKFIDQWQSLNLLVSPNASAKEINALYIDAWKLWIKSLYYQHSVNSAQELARNKCSGCEA